MFSDNVVLCGGNEVDMIEYLESWRKVLERRRMKAKNTVDGMQIRAGGKRGSTNSENMRGREGGMEIRVGAAWGNWKKMLGHIRCWLRHCTWNSAL